MEHFIVKCSKCEVVIGQCRCPSPAKRVMLSVCGKCIEATEATKETEGATEQETNQGRPDE